MFGYINELMKLYDETKNPLFLNKYKKIILSYIDSDDIYKDIVFFSQVKEGTRHLDSTKDMCQYCRCYRYGIEREQDLLSLDFSKLGLETNKIELLQLLQKKVKDIESKDEQEQNTSQPASQVQGKELSAAWAWIIFGIVMVIVLMLVIVLPIVSHK